MVTAHYETTAVETGGITIGGGAPVTVQAMTDTDTADAEATARQCRELADAGAELVRIAVDTHESAAAVPEIKRRLADTGCPVPLIGDFHFNGHVILERNPSCAQALDKYRINPGNVGFGDRHDANFTAICKIAHDHGKAIRIGVNGGSLDRELVTALMAENAQRNKGMTSAEVLDECAMISALKSTESALRAGLGENRIVISCKVSSPVNLIRIYRRLHRETRQPLHLGLTEAGMGVRGLVWSSAAMGTLLAEGIGDTIRVSLTPPPAGDRRDEVLAARELLQSLAIRTFAPSVVSCPGCGRTTSAGFRELAQQVGAHIRDRIPKWRESHDGVEALKVAVMGCVVNGPGESKSADIGISLPGNGETPRCPVFIDGKMATTLEGTPENVTARFLDLIDDYVARRYANK